MNKPANEDAVFSAGHADAGLKKALSRLNELADLLEECAKHVPDDLFVRIALSLRREYRDSFYESAVTKSFQWERRR